MEKISVKFIGERTNGKHYLQPVEIVGEIPETQYQGTAPSGLPSGIYIEKCECHPKSPMTKVVEIIDSEWYSSFDVKYKVVS